MAWGSLQLAFLCVSFLVTAKLQSLIGQTSVIQGRIKHRSWARQAHFAYMREPTVHVPRDQRRCRGHVPALEAVGDKRTGRRREQSSWRGARGGAGDGGMWLRRCHGSPEVPASSCCPLTAEAGPRRPLLRDPACCGNLSEESDQVTAFLKLII